MGNVSPPVIGNHFSNLRNIHTIITNPDEQSDIVWYSGNRDATPIEVIRTEKNSL